MTQSYDLTQLDSASFEHLVNFLSLKVLGNGATGFAPGPDGGRDGYFKGEAPYPSQSEKWSGVWYIQSKFHKPSLSPSANKWLIGEVKKEIASYLEPRTRREIPEIWIIATNIDPSGVSQTGAFDVINRMVMEKLGIKFDIWGGRKILDLLIEHPAAASYYGHFLTPGHVITSLQKSLVDKSAQVEAIVNHFVVNNFSEQIYTKLEQAGSNSDTRPKIHDLFIDLPYRTENFGENLLLESIISSSANTHKISAWNDFGTMWKIWSCNPRRSRVTVVKGGPGQGKSTIGQYFAQIQRAALILGADGPNVTPAIRSVCQELKAKAMIDGFWPLVPRIPITIELKDFAKWFGAQNGDSPKGVLSYLSSRIKSKMGESVLVGTLKSALKKSSWFVIFDGLDEVPNDVKDNIANEIIEFTDELIPLLDADVQILCTTRPQGYSGQFEKLDAATVMLNNLPTSTALRCASAVVSFGRTNEESESAIGILENAMASEQVRELMTTPLQSHIMAVLVRDGGKPPEKRWQLFENFYQVMKKRETLKGFGNANVAKLLQESETLLRAIHSRLGVSLHAKAENSSGAETILVKTDFKVLAIKTTQMLVVENVSEIVDALMEATTERLVFVNTPDDSESVRFDIRQLQEFFAGEFIYTGVDLNELQSRIRIIGSDSHWREVMHFMLSALVVGNRSIELTVVVEALRGLDSCDECHDLRIYNQRIAAGALLSLRLLNEGVLEQDRRVRAKFTDVLKPVFASLDPQVIDNLSGVSHPNSVSWLLSTMADALVELSEPEQVAAAAVLTRILPVEHPRTPEVIDKIMSSSTGYLECIIRLNATGDRFNIHLEEELGDDVSNWFLLELIKIIPNWGAVGYKHEAIDLKTILDFLRSNMKRVAGLIEESPELKVEDRPYFKSLILNNVPEPVTSKEEWSGLKTRLYKCNWSNNILPEFLDFKLNDKTTSPVFLLINKIIEFCRLKSHENYVDIISSLLALDSSFSKALPIYIQALLPIDFQAPNFFKDLDSHLAISPEELKLLLSDGIFMDKTVYPRHQFLSLSDFTTESWRAACGKVPILSLEIWFSSNIYDESVDMKTDLNYSDRILEIAIADPSYFSRYVLSWGALFDIYPQERNRLLKLFCETPYIAPDFLTFSSIISPFKLCLPEDIKFIVNIAEAIVQREIASVNKRSRRLHFNTGNDFSEDVLLGFGLSIDYLKAIFNDDSNPIDLRRAALAIYLSHDFNLSIGYIEFFTEIDNVYFSMLLDSPDWYVTAGIIFCNKNVIIPDAIAAKFLGSILNRYRDNYLISDIAQHVVSRWRERSIAPVTSHKALDPWLTYNVN